MVLVDLDQQMIKNEDGFEEYWTSAFRATEHAKMKKEYEDDNIAEKLERMKMDLFDNKCLGEIDPESVGNDGFLEEFRDVVTPEIETAIKTLYNDYPELKNSGKVSLQRMRDRENAYTTGVDSFYPEDAWTQTYSGLRFNPTNPIPDAILIQDIAHSLSMQCRFNGHTNQFYSVAQHCVAVSYLCDAADALWGLLHDATEAYLCDIPSPLKATDQFVAYREMEAKMQTAICTRFGLEDKEPASVKKADQLMLVTEARDLMNPIRKDWTQICDPVPFKIDPLGPKEAKDLYVKRFLQLIGKSNYYQNCTKV